MQALWMVMAAVFFSTMAVCVKFASQWFNSAELVFYRGLLGMVFMALLARRQGTSLRTAYAGMHAWRSLVGVLSLGAWFYAIAYLPLATAMTLNYMSSVWIAAFLVGGTLLAWRPSAATPRPALQGPLVLTVEGRQAQAARDWVHKLLADGSIAVKIAARYPLSHVREALQHAAGEGRDGKPVYLREVSIIEDGAEEPSQYVLHGDKSGEQPGVIRRSGVQTWNGR